MSEPLNEILKNDEGDDVEAHSLLGPKDNVMGEVMANDEGDDVEAHSLLGPKDNVMGEVMGGVMRDSDESKRGEVLARPAAQFSTKAARAAFVASRGRIALAAEDGLEGLEQPQPVRAALLVVEHRRQPGHHGCVAVTLEQRPCLPRPAEQVEGDRSLIREEAEQLHLLEREPRLLAGGRAP